MTLQTLHLAKLDHGTILSQTPAPGIEIPNADICEPSDLSQLLAPVGAELLVQGIRDEVYLSPPPVGKYASLDDPTEDPSRYPWAPKISSDDRHIDWRGWSAQDILRRLRVLGPIWNLATVSAQTVTFSDGARMRPFKRILMQSLHQIPSSDPSIARLEPLEAGLPFLQRLSDDDDDNDGLGRPVDRVRVWTRDGKVIEIGQIKIEGKIWMEAARAARVAHLFNPNNIAITTTTTRPSSSCSSPSSRQLPQSRSISSSDEAGSGGDDDITTIITNDANNNHDHIGHHDTLVNTDENTLPSKMNNDDDDHTNIIIPFHEPLH